MDETHQKSVRLRCEGWWLEEDCWPNPSERDQGRLIIARKPLKRDHIEEGRNPHRPWQLHPCAQGVIGLQWGVFVIWGVW